MVRSKILHIDFDSFFASCEQQDNESLRGKPIGVTATNGRTCIIASSREAKQYGVKTGSRTFDAKILCPTIQCVPARFARYLEVSKKFLVICRDYTPFVELFSIDEVFMDVTKTHHLFGGTHQIIKRIKERIKNEIGEYITVSIGISHNKLLAKLASSLQKPNGVFEICDKNLLRVYKQAQLTDMCGIGERIKLRLNKIGIYTLFQLRCASLPLLLAEFGAIEGLFLKDVGLGIDTTAIIPYTVAPQVKSVGRNYCLPQNEYNKRKVLQNIYELCEEVALKLRRLDKKAKTAGLGLIGSYSIHQRQTCFYYFDKGKDIFSICLSIMRSYQWFYDPDTYVRQISIWAGNLEDKYSIPFQLFENEKKWDSLTKTIDHLNEKFGDHTIRSGYLLYADKLTTVPNGYMADTFERTKLAQED